MKLVQKLKIFSLLMAMPFITHAALVCPTGSSHYVVSGTADTETLSNDVQSGSMHLTLTDDNGNTAYEKDCGLIGRIVGAVPPITSLDHSVICSSIDSFYTHNDQATPTGANNTTHPTIIDIREHISDISSGDGFFAVMDADIWATGTLNLKTGKNHFTLTGETCR